MGDAIQTSHPLVTSFPFAFNLKTQNYIFQTTVVEYGKFGLCFLLSLHCSHLIWSWDCHIVSTEPQPQSSYKPPLLPRHSVFHWIKTFKIIAYPTYPGFPGSSVSKEPACHCRRQVQSLGWEDPLEKEMATHSNILAWEIPWTEKPGKLLSMELQESDTTEWIH